MIKRETEGGGEQSPIHWPLSINQAKIARSEPG